MKIIEKKIGYNDIAYFIKNNDGKYLCIYEDEQQEQFWKIYKIGKIYEFEEYEIVEVPESMHNTIIHKSDLYNTYLFNEFIKGLK